MEIFSKKLCFFCSSFAAIYFILYLVPNNDEKQREVKIAASHKSEKIVT